MSKLDNNILINPVRDPDWLEDYFNGERIYWNQRLSEEDVVEAEKYIKRHGLKHERGRNGDWEAQYNKGESIAQIAKWFDSTYTRVRKELEDKGYQINDEENWFKLLQSGETLNKIAEEYKYNSKSVSRLLKNKFGKETIEEILNPYKNLCPEWIRLYKEGWEIGEIAKHFRVHPATVNKYIQQGN